MKLNSIDITRYRFPLYYGFTIAIWIAIAILLFTPFSRFVTERILEQSSAFAEDGHSYVLTPIDFKKSGSQIDASELQNKVVQSNIVEISSQSSTTDGRIVTLKKYLLSKNSPLTPYSDIIVNEADKYGLDWRILVGISGVESRFCTVYPAGSYNGWGWRGGPGGDWQRFTGWEDAIRHLTARLALGYGTKLSPADIEPTYCPPCAASDHHWAKAVSQFMREIDDELEKNKISQ